MLSVIVGLALFSESSEFRADRFSLGLRLRRVEAAWLRADQRRKAAALPEVEQAVLRFFGGGLADACRRLDAAAIALGVPSAPFDVRVDPVFGQPGTPVELVVEWTYPAEGDAVLKVQGRETRIEPGQSLRLPLAQGKPAAGTVSARLDWTWGAQRDNWLVRAARDARVANLAGEEGPLGDLVRAGSKPGARLEADLIGSGLLQGGSSVFLGLQDGVPIRAWLARRSAKPPVALVFVHGAGGSEHMVFEALGDGVLAKSAHRMGWSVIAPRLGARSVEASIAFAKARLGDDVRILLAGHSAGGAAIARALASGIRPNAVALFAPAAPPPPSVGGVPVFVAVGKREMAGLRTMAGRWADVPGVEFREEPFAEHLMVVAEAADPALRFLERNLR